jgi:hypothetical protein
MAFKEKGRPAGGDPIPNFVCQDEAESISQRDQPQAAPDNTGESDFEYFTARPHARHRIRAAFPGEFPRKLLKEGNGRPAVVIVGMLRDDTGLPTTRVRSIVFPDGGRA